MDPTLITFICLSLLTGRKDGDLCGERMDCLCIPGERAICIKERHRKDGFRQCLRIIEEAPLIDLSQYKFGHLYGSPNVTMPPITETTTAKGVVAVGNATSVIEQTVTETSIMETSTANGVVDNATSVIEQTVAEPPPIVDSSTAQGEVEENVTTNEQTVPDDDTAVTKEFVTGDDKDSSGEERPCDCSTCNYEYFCSTRPTETATVSQIITSYVTVTPSLSSSTSTLSSEETVVPTTSSSFDPTASIQSSQTASSSTTSSTAAASVSSTTSSSATESVSSTTSAARGTRSLAATRVSAISSTSRHAATGTIAPTRTTVLPSTSSTSSNTSLAARVPSLSDLCIKHCGRYASQQISLGPETTTTTTTTTTAETTTPAVPTVESTTTGAAVLLQPEVGENNMTEANATQEGILARGCVVPFIIGVGFESVVVPDGCDCDEECSQQQQQDCRCACGVNKYLRKKVTERRSGSTDAQYAVAVVGFIITVCLVIGCCMARRHRGSPRRPLGVVEELSEGRPVAQSHLRSSSRLRRFRSRRGNGDAQVETGERETCC